MLLERLADNYMEIGDGLLYSLISVIVVFSVLAIIIATSYGASKLADHIKKKTETNKEEITSSPVKNIVKNTNINDDDMMAAVLVATINFRNEIKEDVRLVSVREIK